MIKAQAGNVIIKETKKQVIDQKSCYEFWGVRKIGWVSLPCIGAAGEVVIAWKKVLAGAIDMEILSFPLWSI